MFKFQYTQRLVKDGVTLKEHACHAFMTNHELLKEMLHVWNNCEAPEGCKWNYHESEKDIAANHEAQLLPDDYKYPALSLLWYSRQSVHLVEYTLLCLGHISSLKIQDSRS